jgi:hypothetical protein
MPEDRNVPADTTPNRFQPGSKFGRPKGAASRHSQVVARLATENVAEVVGFIVEKATDVRAAELLLKYAAPLPRSRLVRFPLPPLNTLADVTAAIAAVLV